MKLTKEQIQSLFRELGIAQAVEIVANADEAEKDFTPQMVIDPFIESKKPVFQAEFEEKILPGKISAAAGEFGGKLNGYIRKASDNQIPLSELEKMNDQDKIQKLVDLLNSNKGKDTEELRKQITDMVEKHSKELEEKESEFQKQLKVSDNRLNDYRISDYLATKIIPTIPLVDGDMKIRTSLLKSALSENYNLVMSEAGELELRDKENIEKPVILNQSVYKPEQFASEFFTGLGIVKSDNRHEDTTSDKSKDEVSRGPNITGRSGIDKTTQDALNAI